MMPRQLVVGRIAQERGFNADSLARKSGVNFYTVRQILNGRTKEPRPRNLMRIAQAMGLTVEDLYEEVPEEALQSSSI